MITEMHHNHWFCEVCAKDFTLDDLIHRVRALKDQVAMMERALNERK